MSRIIFLCFLRECKKLRFLVVCWAKTNRVFECFANDVTLLYLINLLSTKFCGSDAMALWLERTLRSW